MQNVMDGEGRNAADSEVEAHLRLARALDDDGQTDEAMVWYRRAAASGRLPGRVALAKRVIARPPFSFTEGLNLASSAVREGSGEAAHFLAVLAAVGAGVAQSWPNALQSLQRAAELGYRQAQEELGILAGDKMLAQELAAGDAIPRERWRRLRETVSLPTWLAVPRSQIFSQAPHVTMVDGFAPLDACNWLIARARPLLVRAHTFDSTTGAPYVDADRTNSIANFNIADCDVVIAFLRARMAALTGLPTMAMESPAVLHYAPGEQFTPHHDYFEPGNPVHRAEMEQRGQRVVTFLAYLNHDYEGGETSFPVLDQRVKGRRGNGLFFWNVLPDGTPDPKTLHAGLAPKTGEKWLLSQWIRGLKGPSI